MGHMAMTQVVTFYDEDHGFDVDMLADFIGLDEDGRSQYEIHHGVENRDAGHEKCDLSLDQ